MGNPDNEIRSALAMAAKKRGSKNISTGFKGRIIRHSNTHESFRSNPLTNMLIQEAREKALVRAGIPGDSLPEALEVVSGKKSIKDIPKRTARMKIISAIADLDMNESPSYLDREVLVSILYSINPVLSAILIMTGSVTATFGLWREFESQTIKFPKFIAPDASDQSEVLEISLMRYLGAAEITEDEVRKRVSRMSDADLIKALEVLYRGVGQ